MFENREKIDASQLDLKDTVVNISRVTKVVKGGKNLSFSALVVVGDGHGVVGFGIGKAIAERSLDKGIKQVVFDRGGSLYHGRIRAVADAARKAGLEF